MQGAGGVISADPSVNPDFHDFNIVFMRYCDGASFSGNQPMPVQKNGTTLHFNGNAIRWGVLVAIEALGFNKAKEVLVSGCSAGGLATYLHCDWWAEVAGHAKTKCSPDAGEGCGRWRCLDALCRLLH